MSNSKCEEKRDVPSKKKRNGLRDLFVQPLDEPEHRKEVGLLIFKRKRV